MLHQLHLDRDAELRLLTLRSAWLTGLILLFILSLAAINILRLTFRAQRMMRAEGKEGGLIKAALWAVANGDLPIQFSAAAVALAAVWIVVNSLQLYPTSFPIILLFPLLQSFRFGHMGKARFLPSRAVTPPRGGQVLLRITFYMAIAMAGVIIPLQFTPFAREGLSFFLSLGLEKQFLLWMPLLFMFLHFSMTAPWLRNWMLRQAALRGQLRWARPRQRVTEPSGRAMRLLRRYAGHALLSIRIMAWTAAACFILSALFFLSIAFGGRWVSGQAGASLLFLGLLSLSLIPWWAHLRRAQRMRKAEGSSGGLIGAASWAVQEGDLAIRCGYACLLAGLVLGLFLLRTVLSPSTAFFIFAAVLVLGAGGGAYLVWLGHLGRARHLPSRTSTFDRNQFKVVAVILALLLLVLLPLAVSISPAWGLLMLFVFGLALAWLTIGGIWNWNRRVRLMAKMGDIGWLFPHPR